MKNALENYVQQLRNIHTRTRHVHNRRKMHAYCALPPNTIIDEECSTFFIVYVCARSKCMPTRIIHIPASRRVVIFSLSK